MRFAIGRDAFASVVVFLVALPLCLGIAVASGVPIAAGLVTGIVGGLIVGSLAGSPLQVSGPAAGLTVLVFEVVRLYGLQGLAVAVFIAGILQAAAGLFRLGQWFRAVSPAVIHGMLSGIGILIFASQLHVMVDDKPKNHGLQNVATIPEAVAKGLPWPTAEPREIRRERAELSRLIGALHEAQLETANDAIAALDHGPETANAVSPEKLRPALDRQRQNKERLSRLAERIRAANLHAFDEDEMDVEPALHAAVTAIDKALADLESGSTANIQDSQRAAAKSLEGMLGSLKQHDWAAKIGILTILIILAWQYLTPQKLRLIPAPLVAIVTATVLVAWMELPILFVELPDRLSDGITPIQWASLPKLLSSGLIVRAVMIAVIASAESLLCATAVDQMQTGPRTNYDKELFAQGVGNAICGALGALPMTGVIVRSAANVQAGAQSRLSAILHGCWLLLFALVFVSILQYVPMAALAGILVYTGYRLIAPHTIVELWRLDKSEAAIYLITVIAIVSTDLLTGVIVGITLSALKLAYLLSHVHVELNVSDDRTQARLGIHGAATFIRLPVLASRLDEVPAGAELHVDMEKLNYIDHACMDLLMNWAKQHEVTGGRLVIDWGSLHARFRREEARLAVTNGSENRADIGPPPFEAVERVA